MTRVKESLNLAFHGVKTGERTELFRDVADWLREMNTDDTTGLAAAQAYDLAKELAEISGPCGCSIQLCEHWKSEAAIILTSALLLSLVKSQEAEIKLLRAATAEGGDYGATVYNGEGNYTLLAQNAISRNVDQMRSACVAKVKSMRDEWQSEAGWNWGTQVGTANKIVTELESLTLQEQKP